ncbi:hypothetical protein [Paenarthrobacter sp. JL.01a]|uniref:hypothetical protein n=1 Tax=Paenarthrobacter sp. JL.01a TaxID=2979324 RepID=UPI0021C65CAD|nr:hypothetical protein [Paenarthrobacter sp. JL.01a]UXM90910.1 hypothetical protein N5P29_16665 [Paenarthrobacter sp. JL.01a]
MSLLEPTNLLTETLDAIERSGHTPEQVTFVGSQDAEYRCTWDEFTVLADVTYDDGYGAAEVATDLIIRFDDGRKMWRGEYDGSEWWEFDPIGTVDYSNPGKPIQKLTGGMWVKLAELHAEDDDQ